MRNFFLGAIFLLASQLSFAENCYSEAKLKKDYWLFNYRSNDPLAGAVTEQEKIEKRNAFLKRNYDNAAAVNAALGVSADTTFDNRAGGGLYLAGDPAISQAYGPVMVAVKIKKGSDIIDARGCELRAGDSSNYEMLKKPVAAILYDFSEAAEAYFLSRSAVVVRSEGVLDPESFTVYDTRTDKKTFAFVDPAYQSLSFDNDILSFVKNYATYRDALNTPSIVSMIDEPDTGLASVQDVKASVGVEFMLMELGKDTFSFDNYKDPATQVKVILEAHLAEAGNQGGCVTLVACQKLLSDFISGEGIASGSSDLVHELLYSLGWISLDDYYHRTFNGDEQDRERVVDHWWDASAKVMQFLKNAAELKSYENGSDLEKKSQVIDGCLSI